MVTVLSLRADIKALSLPRAGRQTLPQLQGRWYGVKKIVLLPLSEETSFVPVRVFQKKTNADASVVTDQDRDPDEYLNETVYRVCESDDM